MFLNVLLEVYCSVLLLIILLWLNICFMGHLVSLTVMGINFNNNNIFEPHLFFDIKLARLDQSIIYEFYTL